jgi:hypothetical protein
MHLLLLLDRELGAIHPGLAKTSLPGNTQESAVQDPAKGCTPSTMGRCPLDHHPRLHQKWRAFSNVLFGMGSNDRKMIHEI